MTLKRASATIRKKASALQTASFDSAEGPWRKKGGGALSSVPNGMVRASQYLGRFDLYAYSLVKMEPKRSI